MPQYFDPSFQILKIWIQGSGLLAMWHQKFVFQKYLKNILIKFKIRDRPSAWILRFNLRLGCYSIWSAIVHRTPYMKIFIRWRQDYSSRSTTQPRCSSRSTSKACFAQSSGTIRRQLQKYSKTCYYLAAKSSGACQTRGHGIPDVAHFNTRYVMGHVLYLCVM